MCTGLRLTVVREVGFGQRCVCGEHRYECGHFRIADAKNRYKTSHVAGQRRRLGERVGFGRAIRELWAICRPNGVTKVTLGHQKRGHKVTA